MSHFSIISSQGQHPVLFTGAPRYVGAYLKPGYLEFPEIGSPTAIGWHVGDYVVYSRTGRTYRLYGTPKATEQADANKYGAAFLYENVQFFDDMKQWELCPFTDLVPGDNTVHFSTQGVVSFFGKPSNVAERLQACLENQYGTGSWEVRIVDTSDSDLLEILNTEVEFSVSGVNCLQVLDKVYDTWNKLGWAYTIENGKNILTIGAPNDRTAANTTEGYSYGDGLVAVEKSIANAAEIGTRLFAYGSMKNMDATYYRGLDIYQAESVDIEHLMIPISNWGTTSSKPDARKAYIQDASAIAKMGIIPRTAYFDGTGDLPDIHPTIERMTIGEVYDAGGAGYLPDLSKWSRNQRIDEIISANNPSDEGAASDMGVRFKESISGTLDAVTEVGPANEYIEPDIFTTTLTKSGRLVLKFGRNAQTITINSAWDARFNVATLEVSNGSNLEVVPLKIEPVSSTSFTFVLPEQVVIQNAVAGALRVGLNIFVLDNAPTAQTDTVTIGIDGTTTIEGGVVYMLDKTFSVTIPQIGFDIEKYAELGNGKKISMKTGMCAGRDFEIRELSYQSSTDSWLLTLYRSNDEDLNILFPNVDYPIAAGDQFVLLDIAMPEMYVTVASQRLLEAAQKLLADISEEKPFYAPQIDAKTVIDESRILLEGLWMDISFNGVQEYALIDSITIDENGSNIPTYDVALRQEKGLDWTENIGSASSGKSSVSVSGNEGIDPKGTVTSVGLTAPEGMKVEGSPVTGAGVLELKLAQGYKIPLISELAQYFELGGTGDPSGLVKLKALYDLLGVGKGVVFNVTPEADVADSSAHLMLRNMAAPGDDPDYALYTPFHLITGGDQIVLGGTPGGGGGGGGASYLWELLDVDDNLQSPAAGALLQYDSVAGLWKGTAPATQIGAGVTGFTTGALIRSVLGDDFNAQWSVKQFINSSIATATATFRGTNTTATTEAAFLTWANGLTHDLNDYVFWKTTDSLGNTVYKRYKYDGSQWVFEYELNNSSFTSQQWDAINSGITSGKVGTYDTIAGYFSGGKILSTALPAMYIGKTAVQFTSATQDLEGIGNITMDNAKYLRAYNSARDTLYNLAGLNASNYGYLGAANSPRTYTRGKSLYFLTGDSGNTSALVINASQVATFYGAVYLQNNKSIFWKNKPAEGASEINIELLRLSSSNILTLGSGLISTGNNGRAYNTELYGGRISFYTGDSTNGATRKWYISSAGDFIPDGEYRIGSSGHYVKEAYAKKIYLASGIYLEYNDTNGYVYLNAPLVTNGDQIVLGGTPGGGGGSGVCWLHELYDTDENLPSKPQLSSGQYAALIFDPSATDKVDDNGAWKYATIGGGLSFSNGVLSATQYTAGTGISISNANVISVAANTYVKLDPGVAEQTIKSSIAVLTKGVINFYRSSGDHYTFLGFSNGTTETFLGGLGFKSQSDNNLYHWIKSGASSSYSIIYDAGNCNKSDADWACKDLTAVGIKVESGRDAKVILNNTDTENYIQWISFRQGGTEYGVLGTVGNADLKWGASYSTANIIYHAGNCNKSDVDWACDGLTANEAIIGSYTATNAVIQFRNTYGTFKVQATSYPAAMRIGYGDGPLLVNAAGNVSIESGQALSLKIKRTVSDKGAYMAFYPGNQDTNYWDIGSSADNVFRFEYKGTLLDSISTTGAMTIRSSAYDGLSIKRTATGSAGLRFFPDNQDTHYWYFGTYGNGDNYMLRFTYDGSDKAYFLTDGTLRTAGDQVITSDIRMKKNLKPIDLKVEDIAKCRAVTFDWTTGGHSFGSIAQDWEPILPEAVKQEDIKTLAYGQAALVAAINIAKHDTKQDEEIRQLREDLAASKKEIKWLKAEVKRLRS